MKVLQVMATSGGVGGLEQHTFNLCRQLSQQGVEVHLLLDQSYQYLQLSLQGITTHFVDFSLSRRNPCLIYKVYRQVKAITPNLIHTQGGKATKIIGSLLRFLNTPSIATVHGMKNHLNDYSAFTHVIAVSEKVADLFQQQRAVSVIHNGIEVESPTQIVKADVQQRAIAIGRLAPVKGFDRLLEAWQSIDFKLDIVGEGDERDRLEKLIQEYHLQDRVSLLGFKANIVQEIQNSCFVIVSSLKEGGPIVVAEALLHSVPVIATDVGMAKAYIPTEYIAMDADVAALQALIQFTLQRLDMLDTDFKTAYMKAAQQLTLSGMTEKTLHEYRQLLHLNA